MGSDSVNKNMTEGRPLLLMLQFAVPLLIGNLLQQTYNMIDAAIVGRTLGADALASVGSSSSVLFLVLGFCIGACSGFSIPAAQCFGAREYEKMRNYIFQGGVLTTVIALILTTVCMSLCTWILDILSVPVDLYENAHRYLLIIFLGLPFTLLYNYVSGILRAIGDSRTPFIFLAVSTVLNIFLDLFCILVLHWGCAGAAAATVAAQAASGIACLVYIVKKVELLHLTASDCRMKKRAVGSLLALGLPMGLQFSITAIGSMVMQAANNGLGSICVSGFTVAARIKQFAMCPFDAIATAVSVFCSQNLGAGKLDRVRKGILQGMTAGILYGVLAGLMLIFGGRMLSMFFISAESAAVLDASEKYLRCMGYFYWCLGILNTCRLSTQGLGYSGRAVVSGVVEMIARCIVSFAFVPVYGFTAICFADQTAWLSACIYIGPMCFWCIRKEQRKKELSCVQQ